MTCHHPISDVYESRRSDDPSARQVEFDYLVMRRRRCLECGEKFVTYELSQEQMDTVAMRRQAYIRDRLVALAVEAW